MWIKSHTYENLLDKLDDLEVDKEAAKKARKIQFDVGNKATIFKVSLLQEKPQFIDVLEEEV